MQYKLSRRRFVRGTSALAGVGAALSFLPARSFADAKVDVLDQPEVRAWYEAAKEEGEVTYYASNNPALSERMAVGFNARYPEIKVNIVRLASGPLGKRYATEAEAGTFVADILQLGDPTIIKDGYEKGWFTTMEDLPAHQAWPAEYKAENYAVANIFPGTITYNTNLVSAEQAPKTWPDLLVPKRKGLLLAPGNPHKLTQLEDIARPGLRLAHRQPDAGVSHLLQSLLARHRIEGSQLTWAEHPSLSEDDLALAIRQGEADVGVGIEAAARRQGLAFIPLQQEHFDLAMRRRHYFEPAMQRLLEFARCERFVQRAEALGGYDISELGKVMYNA